MTALIWNKLQQAGVVRLALPALTVVLLKLQGLYFHHQMLGRTQEIEEPGLELCMFLVLVPLLALLPKVLRYLACAGLVVLSTVLLEIDALYYRFFSDLPSLHLIPAWYQAGKTTQSVGDFWEADDKRLLWAFAVLALGLLVGGYLERRKSQLWAPLLGLGLAIAFTVSTYHQLHPVRHEQLQRRFQNVAVGKIFGPLFYHAYDCWEWGRVELGWEGGRAFDSELVARLVKESRASALTETPYKGMYEGRDFLFVQLESLEYFALHHRHDGELVMPFLSKAAERAYGFRLLDQTHLGRSADGEFIFLNSLHPPAARALPFVYPNNSFAGLPTLFKGQGYHTVYLHPSDPNFWNSRLLASAYGFDEMAFREEMPARDSSNDIRGWGLTDQALFSQVVERLNDSPSPSFFYIVTMMCHHPYSETKDRDVSFPPAKSTSMVRRYLRCARLRDQSIERFVAELAETERGRRTVVCLVGDHEANLSKTECKRLGLPLPPERESVPAVIFSVEEILGENSSPMPKPEAKFGGQIDLAPSIGHVFSLNMEESVFLGWNLFGKQNNKPRISRVGPWMDRNGTIWQSEDAPEDLDISPFDVSEMLLQGNRIQEIRHSR